MQLTYELFFMQKLQPNRILRSTGGDTIVFRVRMAGEIEIQITHNLAGGFSLHFLPSASCCRPAVARHLFHFEFRVHNIPAHSRCASLGIAKG